ncbi:hypothetical protein CDAR_496801 [Caerostris darwini]|uniref:Uncharacterized protein n=1 Tax=Caerostris darwini TaxID=1538125 RepID=A0AAV4U581_9ARAC|nr:hypothetical protein CDAR_496801 [Caerostris darwini]
MKVMQKSKKNGFSLNTKFLVAAESRLCFEKMRVIADPQVLVQEAASSSNWSGNSPCMRLFNFAGAGAQRSPEPADQEARQEAGREAAPHGLHRRPAVAAEAGVPGEPLPDGEAAAGPRQGPQAAREPDQDLVPEQAGQDQEGQRATQPAGAAAHGSGTLQPQHHPHTGRRGRGAAQVVLLLVAPPPLLREKPHRTSSSGAGSPFPPSLPLKREASNSPSCIQKSFYQM